MTSTSIVRDTNELNRLITKTIRLGATYFGSLHIAAVSALVHAAESGRAQPLNKLFDSLNTNDKTSFKNYINRIHCAIGGIDWADAVDEEGKAIPMPADILATAKEAGTFLVYTTKEGFVVKQGVTPQRRDFIKLAEETLIEPDGVVWRRFFDRNNLAEVKLFGDAEFMKALKTLQDKIEGDANTESKVSAKLKAAFKNMKEFAEAFVETNSEVKALSKPVIKLEANAPVIN